MDKEEKSFWKRVYLVYGRYDITRYRLEDSFWKESVTNGYLLMDLINQKYVLPRQISIAHFQFDFTNKFIEEIFDVV